MLQTPQFLEANIDGPLAQHGRRWAVLLLHGFTAGPSSVLPWGQALASAGATVKIPLLAGHGTNLQDLASTTASQWRADTQRALDELIEQDFDHVAVAGLSLGGALALDAAAHRPVDMTFVVNPALTFRFTDQLGVCVAPLLRYVIPNVGPLAGDIRKPGVTEVAYDRTPVAAVEELAKLFRTVRKNLSKISSPIQMFRSTTDHIVPRSSSSIIQSSFTPYQLNIVSLTNSYHVATLDYDAPVIHSNSIETMQRITKGRYDITRS